MAAEVAPAAQPPTGQLSPHLRRARQQQRGAPRTVPVLAARPAPARLSPRETALQAAEMFWVRRLRHRWGTATLRSRQGRATLVLLHRQRPSLPRARGRGLRWPKPAAAVPLMMRLLRTAHCRRAAHLRPALRERARAETAQRQLQRMVKQRRWRMQARARQQLQRMAKQRRPRRQAWVLRQPAPPLQTTCQTPSP